MRVCFLRGYVWSYSLIRDITLTVWLAWPLKHTRDDLRDLWGQTHTVHLTNVNTFMNTNICQVIDYLLVYGELYRLLWCEHYVTSTGQGFIAEQQIRFYSSVALNKHYFIIQTGVRWNTYTSLLSLLTCDTFFNTLQCRVQNQLLSSLFFNSVLLPSLIFFTGTYLN